MIKGVIRGSAQVEQVWSQSYRGDAEIAWACVEEGQWFYWTKDVDGIL